jgi:hypothetical protein
MKNIYGFVFRDYFCTQAGKKQALKKAVNIRRCFTSSFAALPAVPAAQA